MPKDPAFLFYPGDASEDTQFMNRLERGAYFDILKAQKKFGKFTIDQLKKVLGNDFQSCWPSLELVLKFEDGFYFIEWVAEKIDTRKINAQKNKDRIQKYWNDKNGNTNVIPKNNLEEPLVNEDGNEDVLKGVQGENKNWNTMPLPKNVDDLPKIKIGSVQELLKITKQVDVSVQKVVGMWDVFKIQNLTGKKYYADVGDVHSHFINWIKKQDFEETSGIPGNQQQTPVYKKL